jgi:hypothetical protein
MSVGLLAPSDSVASAAHSEAAARSLDLLDEGLAPGSAEQRRAGLSALV